MPIQFLVPAILAGLAAIVIPVVVHLTRKRRSRVVRFPSLMFLERVPYRAESRRRIHHWFLLSLRALAVALLVLAFARPFFTDADAAAATGAGPQEVVILLDRSYSMAVGDRWERALQSAREAVDGLGPLDRASVVFYSQGARVAVRSTTDRARLRGALDTASVGSEATRYGPGLKLAQTILDESELAAGRVWLIGDLQRAGWTGDEGVRFRPGTVVTPVVVGEPPGSNTAVAGVTLDRESLRGRDRITPTARLTRVGGEDPVEAEAVLEIDGRELQRRTVTLPPSGAATVTFQPFTLTERHTRGTVRLEPDALPHDDLHHFVISPGSAIRVTLVARPGGDASLYVRRALEIGPEARFATEVVGNAAALGEEALAGRSVVLLHDRPFPGGSAGRALRAWVAAGGGLLVALGESSRWPEAEADLLPGRIGRVVDRAPGRGDRLGDLDYGHPVFELFAGPRTGDFTRARFFRSRLLTPAAGDDVAVLARYDDGTVALAERKVGEGRVLVWTSTMDAFWNDLALQPVFLPFVHELVRYASGRSEALPAFLAGQVVDVSDARAMETAGLGEAARALRDMEERVALTPSGGSVALPVGEGMEPRFLTLDEQGFYEIRPPGADESVRPLAVAVNVDPAEADLAALDPDEVVASVLSGGGGEALPADQAARAARLRADDQERRQSLWRFLLVGAFVILALETAVSNWLSRRTGRRGIHATG